MTFLNEGEWDRAARLAVGALLLVAAAAGLGSGTLGMVALGVGAVALSTGIGGWCPAYTVFGFSTRKGAVRSCPSCEPDRRP
jgi:Inner membrane protein YgaP-like, transmembrane domain